MKLLGNKTLFAFSLLIVLSLPCESLAIECPKIPEQAKKEWDVEVKAAVGKIGPVKGAELETRTRNAVKDLMSKLPEADKVYLEQMMYATYCSALRDDKAISDSEKASRIRAYNLEVRKTLYKVPNKTSGEPQGALPVDKRMEARLRLGQMALPFTSEAFVKHAKQGDVDVVKLFLMAGMDPNTRDDKGATVLMHAVMQGHREVMNAMLKAKASVNEKNEWGWTALAYATGPDKKDILITLLKQGPDVHALNTAFVSAASKGDRETARMLKTKGADVKAIWHGTRIADLAVLNAVEGESRVSEEDLNETVKYLLDLGANVNTLGYQGRTPLMNAIEGGRLKIARTLLDKGADVNLRASCGCLHNEWTPLMFAAWYDRPAIVGPLLDQGADINVKCNKCYSGSLRNGSTALMIAALHSREVMEILIKRNAEVGRRNDRGETALLLAAEGADTAVLERLLGTAPDMDQRDQYGYTALRRAVESCRVDNTRVLLDRGADMNIRDDDGETLLMAAIGQCEEESEIVSIVLGKSMDINASTKEGKTALMMAAERGQIKSVKALLERGADAKQKDLYGKSAQEFAEKSRLKGEEREKMLWMLRTASDSR